MVIDLRSDTVTQPSEAMREAAADAPASVRPDLTTTIGVSPVTSRAASRNERPSTTSSTPSTPTGSSMANGIGSRDTRS